MCISRRELSNEYLLTKNGVDTAEHEPMEVIQFISSFASFLQIKLFQHPENLRGRSPAKGSRGARRRLRRHLSGIITVWNIGNCLE